MEHEPRRCRQDDRDYEEQFVDGHSGSRLVIVLLMIPLSVFAGWAAYRVARELGRALLDPVTAGRLSYVAGGLGIAVVVLLFLRWQYALSPRVQSHIEQPIDDMSDEPNDEWEE
jgi:hypothetical protein